MSNNIDSKSKFIPTVVAVGPHHGECEFPFSESYEVKNITPDVFVENIDVDQMIDKFGEEGAREGLKNTLRNIPHEMNLEEDLWGFISILRWNHSVNRNEQGYVVERAAKQLIAMAIEEFLLASGDDTIFDYVPGFIDSVEQALRLWGEEQRIELMRKAMYVLRPGFPEFFTDEEVKEFSR